MGSIPLVDSPAPAPASTPPPAPPPGAFDLPTVVPIAARVAEPSRPDPSAGERRVLPAWAYAGLGAAAALVIGGVGMLAWVFIGSRPAKRPDPSIDVIPGVASSSAEQHPAPSAPRLASLSGSQVVSPMPAGATGNPATTGAANPWNFNSAAQKNNPPAPIASVPPPANGPLTTAQIVARWEPSVALVRGDASIGTGFIVRPGLIATNAHVIDDEFISSLELQFPSAPEGKKGPLPAELLYEDPKRDLAFLAVGTDLPPTAVASSYNFTKGEDILVIGNPGLGDDVVLQNAISRGVMSSKTVIDGMNYLQLNIAINPGNSGGPVFDSTGRVIGVATLKSTRAEALAFCIPSEDLNSALNQVGPPPPELASGHRARVAFKMLTTAGAVYGIGLDYRALVLARTRGLATPNFVPDESSAKLDELIRTMDEKLFSQVDDEIPHIQQDAAMAQNLRNRYQDLWKTYHTMKNLYDHPRREARQYASQVQATRGRLLSQVQALSNDLKMPVPAELTTLLTARVTDGSSQTIVTRIVPGHVQSRIMRGRGRLTQRGPIHSRPGLHNTLRNRSSARDRMRSRMHHR